MNDRKPWQCSRCGSDAGVYVNRRVYGWENWTVFGDGRREINDDVNAFRLMPKTGECRTCGGKVDVPPAP